MIETLAMYIVIGCIIALITQILDFLKPSNRFPLTLCVDKYRKTGNTEYLCDAANYLMFEFMYPQVSGAHFNATDSKDSAGVAGKPIGPLHEQLL